MWDFKIIKQEEKYGVCVISNANLEVSSSFRHGLIQEMDQTTSFSIYFSISCSFPRCTIGCLITVIVRVQSLYCQTNKQIKNLAISAYEASISCSSNIKSHMSLSTIWDISLTWISHRRWEYADSVGAGSCDQFWHQAVEWAQSNQVNWNMEGLDLWAKWRFSYMRKTEWIFKRQKQ